MRIKYHDMDYCSIEFEAQGKHENEVLRAIYMKLIALPDRDKSKILEELIK